MAGLVVLDTDLVIDFLRGRGPGASLTRTLLAEHRLRLTALTGFELRVGLDFLARKEILRLFRQRTIPVDLAAALRAGEIAAALRSNGTDIGLADCLQAGTCLRYRLPFATRNRKHLERVDGLELVPVEP